MYYLIIFFLCVKFVIANELAVVKIGVLAKRGDDWALHRWNPTAQYLTDKIPNKIFKIIPLSFSEIFDAVDERKIDFILANSGLFVELEYNHRVRSIATLINKYSSKSSQNEFGGVIFSLSKYKNRFNSIEKIKGTKSFAAVDEKSFGGWQMAWRELVENNIDVTAALTFKRTHDNVVYAVLNEEAEVGTVRTDTLERMAIEGKINLKNFHIINRQYYENFPFLISTKLYPEWPFAKLYHTSKTLSKQVSIALMQMKHDDNAATSANINGWGTPLNYRPVHDAFKVLEIPPYYHPILFFDILQKYWKWILFYIFLSISAFIMLANQLRLTRHLKRTQKQLIESEKMASLGGLVAGVAHEINTPVGSSITGITHIKDVADALKVDYENNEMSQTEFENFLNIVIKLSNSIYINLRHAAELVTTFKKVAVERTVNMEYLFTLRDIIDQVLISLHNRLKNANINIITECQETIEVKSNPSAITQILTNLILNSQMHAFQQVAKNREIKIVVNKQNQHIHIIYKDNGKGISKNVLPKIFDPFFTTSRKQGGTGLGLHIVYNIVTQQLGGTIRAKSKVGEGVEFEIIF